MTTTWTSGRGAEYGRTARPGARARARPGRDPGGGRAKPLETAPFPSNGPVMFRWSPRTAPGWNDRVRLLRIFGEIGARLPSVRAFALQALRAAGRPNSRNRRLAANAALAYVRQRLVWSPEVDEQFWRPDRTLEAGGGDCDDLSSLLYAVLRNYGVPPEDLEFAFIRDWGVYKHVWPKVYLPPVRQWYPLEPSLSTLPPGRSPMEVIGRGGVGV